MKPVALGSTISQPLRWGSASKTTLRGEFSISWHLPAPNPSGGGTPVMCGVEDESHALTLGCPAGQTISTVKFGEYGTPGGSCPTLSAGKCGGNNLVASISAGCVGKPSCVVECQGSTCTLNGKKILSKDPCFQTKKKLAAAVTCKGGGPSPKDAVVLTVATSVPHTAIGTTRLPLLGVDPVKLRPQLAPPNPTL
eukprot:SAG31_NODE_1385_length_8573_cov_27.673118_8_plen_195_part_00